MQAAVTQAVFITLKQLIRYLSLMLAGISPIVAGSASSAAAGTSIESLVAEVVTSNPELEFYEAEMAAAKAGQRAAGLLDDPELAADVGRKQTAALDGTNFGDGAAWSVSLRQTFEWPGRLGLRKSIANSDVNLAELGLAQFRAALAARARLLAYGLVAAQEQAAATREVADRFAALLDVLTQRDPAGMTPLLEFRIIEATVLTLQRRAATAELSISTSLLELNQLRGMPAQAPIHIDTAELVFRPAESLDALLDLARSNNFELRVRLAELTQQGFRVDLTKNERYPSFSVAPFYSQQRAADSERVIGLGISVPLPLRKRNAMNLAISQARQQQAQAMVTVAQRDLERKLAASVLAYESKLAEMAAWHPNSLQQFRQAAALADRHYRLGAVAVTTYVELQRQYLDAVEALVETKREALAAASEIELLTGRTTPLVTLTPARD
jgi:cobalt-zinc-cadmium efflux system outer membrane protein